MNERGMETGEQMTNREKIQRLDSLVESFSSDLNSDDVTALSVVKEKISARILSAKQTESEKLAEVRSGSKKFIEKPKGDFEKKEGEDRAKILLKSAIDSFVRYARRLETFSADRLTSPGGAYGFNTTSPSEGFCGDLRMVEGKLDKEMMVSDQVDRDTLLNEARELMPDIVARIELLLNEYDDWGNFLERKKKEGEEDFFFEPTLQFKKMSQKVCDALEKIKGELN